MTEVKNEFNENERTENEMVDTAIEDNEVEASQELEDSVDENERLIEELNEKLNEAEDRRLRLLADFDNYKRRAALDQEALQKYRAQAIMTNLLPVLDNFGRALAVEAKTEEVQSMMTGMEMIYRSLFTALESEGLVEINAGDVEFDPNFHQAIMTGKDEDKPSGAVLEEFQKGYMLKDRVLRPAMVKVNE